MAKPNPITPPPQSPPKPPPVARKVYSTPRLVVYGRVIDLTRSGGRRGRSDSRFSRRKT